MIDIVITAPLLVIVIVMMIVTMTRHIPDVANMADVHSVNTNASAAHGTGHNRNDAPGPLLHPAAPYFPSHTWRSCTNPVIGILS